MRNIFALMTAAVMLGETLGLPVAYGDASVQDSQALAVRLYPALAINDSPLNQRFVAEYNRLKIENPGFFNDSSWPVVLAKECSDSLSKDSTLSDHPVATNPNTPQDIVSQAPISPMLQLAKGWDGVMTGGEMTIDDIQEVLKNDHANKDLSFHNIPIYGGVKYLMPVRDALKALGKDHQLEPKTLCSSPAFPQSSFFYYGLDNQPDEYNRLYLIVDSADQAVGVQLVDEAPKGTERGDLHWHCYNFVFCKEKKPTRRWPSSMTLFPGLIASK